MEPAIPWVTVWGYGADIRATPGILSVRTGGEVTRYPLADIRHLLIAGGHSLQTSAVSHLMEQGVSISFFDVHGTPAGSVRPPGADAHPLRSAQKSIPVHRLTMSVITASRRARLMLLNELGSSRADGLYYQGELEILADASRELEFLITLPELARVFSLTRDMYYEILSRVIAPELGYRRRERPPYPDPVNAMFAHGYAVLYANVMVAAEGAGLDPGIGALYGGAVPVAKGRGACVLDMMETMTAPLVDRVVVSMAEEDLIRHRYEMSSRCILSEGLMQEFNRRLAATIRQEVVNRVVAEYADAVTSGRTFEPRV